MKMTVIANQSGEVISIYAHPDHAGKDDPIMKILGGPGDIVHELKVPAEFGKITSAEELHKRVGEHLKSR